METAKCSICEGEFYVSKMKDGKCDDCNMRFPGIKNKEELTKAREAQNEEYNKGNLKSIIKTEVDKILEEYGILSRCEKCGKLFIKKSPAQKSCGNCGDKK